MSGHSKWSTIKRKKEVTDTKRGKIFTKLAKDITVTARQGGDPLSNPALRVAIEKAKLQNMPKRNIERAIARGTGTLDGVQVVEGTYEGYGSGGVAFYIFCLTDNRNRTISDIKHAFLTHNGSMGSTGSVAYIFNGDKATFKTSINESDLSKCKALYALFMSMSDVIEVKHNCESSLDA